VYEHVLAWREALDTRLGGYIADIDLRRLQKSAELPQKQSAGIAQC
jgi:hypothetical protein